MVKDCWLFLVSLLLFSANCLADGVATWPSSIDELEDIMLLNSGYRARQFAIPVTPCSFSRLPGSIPAAGFVRTAFHDMAEHNANTGVGGLDGSIAYELFGTPWSDVNIGPGFNNTVIWYSGFYNSRASIADLVAMGLYTAVRGCGGPAIPVRVGRIDAVHAGTPGVPHPNDTQASLKSDFQRMGFGVKDMISMVACGHTLGGVHAREFPQIVPPGSHPDNVANFDSTFASYDNQIAVEYVSNTTKNPLVVGPNVTNSDERIFSADGGLTIKQLASAQVYQSTCKDVLQRMIDTVPKDVKLTKPIVPYTVKPGKILLTVSADGKSLQFSGEVRVRDTTKQSSSVQILYQDRYGGSSCGKCVISTSVAGRASGFDDSFTFYSFSNPIDASTSISSFKVIVSYEDGSSTTYDNNGKDYPVQDVVTLQAPLCSFNPSINANGKQNLSVVAAIRDAHTARDVTLTITVQVPQNNTPVRALQVVPIRMTQKSSIGKYTLFSADYEITQSQANSTRFDMSAIVNSKMHTDSFHSIADFRGGVNSTSPQNPSTTSTKSKTSTALHSSTSATKTGDGENTATDHWSTTVVSSFTTYCPEPTVFTHAGMTITVTKATTLTITECPCTLSVPVSVKSGTISSGSSTDSTLPSISASTAEASTIHVRPNSTSAVAAVYTGAASCLIDNIGFGFLVLGVLVLFM